MPDDIQSPKAEVEPPKKEEQKKPGPVKSVGNNNPATVAATEKTTNGIGK